MSLAGRFTRRASTPPDRPPGCFRITAPTGSGKTLAMLAFALKHAEQHGLRRVIVVLPFLAIIEQNARVYREALQSLDDAGVLIEHHSAVMVSGDDGSERTENESQDRTRAKQATENWDAPVIVTTAVQFLESLFSRRPASCRKLHNIARSVVVFDEVQTLPFPLLDPILSAVRTLRDMFGVSFLFGSATQPHLQCSPNLPSGFAVDGAECHEIVPELGRTFAIFRRVTLELPCLTEPPWTWDDLVTRLDSTPQALIIVNLRKHAQDLFDRLRVARTPGLFHLSSTMCAAPPSGQTRPQGRAGAGDDLPRSEVGRPMRRREYAGGGSGGRPRLPYRLPRHRPARCDHSGGRSV